MLSQVPAEAVYSATYVENYLDCVENLPNDLQRLISRMRELDVNYLARVREAEAQSELWKTLGSENAARKGKTFFRMQQALSAAQELGDEKMTLLQTILEKIEMKTRLLDQDHKNLDFGKEESTGTDTKDTSNSKTSGTSGGTPSAVNSTGGSERPVKRARRTRHDTYTEPTPPNDTSLNTSNNNSNTGNSGSTHNNTTASSNNTNTTNHPSATNAISSATATTAVATVNSNTATVDSVNNTTGNTGGGNNSAAATSGSLSTSNSNSGGGSGTTTSSSTQKKNSASSATTGGGATGKKKKRKSRNQQMAIAQAAAAAKEDTPPPRDEEPVIDPNEPTYCLCDQISFGEMIMCDNDLCPIEWFHFSCVSLATKPKGKWYCPKCRGDRPNVMKPKAQFLRELERFNKEKEEKT